jgi:hypothetical protein
MRHVRQGTGIRSIADLVRGSTKLSPPPFSVPRIVMRHRVRSCAGIFALALLTGCFHTQVYTGLPAGGETLSRPWAHGFLFGLVPPSTVEPATKCRAGVYKVETMHTPTNLLALFITAGIYSPMRIDVTCAYIPRLSTGNRPSAPR